MPPPRQVAPPRPVPQQADPQPRPPVPQQGVAGSAAGVAPAPGHKRKKPARATAVVHPPQQLPEVAVQPAAVPATVADVVPVVPGQKKVKMYCFKCKSKAHLTKDCARGAILLCLRHLEALVVEVSHFEDAQAYYFCGWVRYGGADVCVVPR